MAITAQQVKELRDMTGVGMMDAKKALVATEGDMEKAVDFLREKGLASAGKKADRIAAEGMTATHVDGNTAALIEVNAETDFVTRNDQFKTLVATVAKAIAEGKPADLDAALALTVDGQTVNELIINAINTIGEKISLRRFELFTKTDADSFGTYIHTDGSIGVLTLVEGTTDETVAKDVAMHAAAMNPKYVSRDEVSEEDYAHEEKIQTEIALNEGKPANIVEKMIKGRMNKYLAEISLTEQAFVKNPDQTVGEYAASKGGKVVKFTRFLVGEGMEKRQENFAEEVAAQMNNN
ncbi:elongation factor Ts [Aerococcaceae bacterium zg-ZJ1578]|uniref:translation elongation factor Ts n=1 Tax=Aerococcaceae TaxID=186827 RepID=UPI0013BD04F0|nr:MULTISPECIES: translation elongation factor Ts [unclassified Facklamia]MBK0348906.1 elongation factor Ts [Aerococcaceae bacterium zg-1578]NEW63683.1 elongation factor Ts [Facklamia sp. 252]NEW67154.1 elongation factor Ts [Facklamia sp. 253]QQD66305.1 elongation factor Ts [Aerococcaceae bacterium zg-252]